jgi:hypothetical protein
MNIPEAKSILRDHLSVYKSQSYSDLVKLVNTVETMDAKGPSGKMYQLEIQFLWDDKPNGDIRVMGSVDDGGLRAFFPVTDSFIVTANGQLIG